MFLFRPKATFAAIPLVFSFALVSLLLGSRFGLYTHGLVPNDVWQEQISSFFVNEKKPDDNDFEEEDSHDGSTESHEVDSKIFKENLYPMDEDKIMNDDHAAAAEINNKEAPPFAHWNKNSFDNIIKNDTISKFATTEMNKSEVMDADLGRNNDEVREMFNPTFFSDVVSTDTSIDSLHQSTLSLIKRSENMVKMTTTERVSLLHDVESELRSHEKLLDQVSSILDPSFSELNAAVETMKDVLGKYFAHIPDVYMSMEGLPNSEKQDVAKPQLLDIEAQRRLFGKAHPSNGKSFSEYHFSSSSQSRFGSRGQFSSGSGGFQFNSMIKKPRQNPYRHRELPVTEKNFHSHVLHNWNNQGNGRKLSKHKDFASFMRAGSPQHSPFGHDSNNIHRRMFQNTWPTDAPVPTEAPSDPGTPLEQNCGLLVECVSRMSLYDLFVLYHSDDIDISAGTLDIQDDDEDDPDDDPFATFRTFDEQDIVFKFRIVKRLAEGLHGNLNIEDCSALLQEFHRVVEFGEVNNWEGSSVSQVCLAEGTPVFVKLSEIAKVKSNMEKEIAKDPNRNQVGPTLGEQIATEVFRDFFACTDKLYVAEFGDLETGIKTPFRQNDNVNFLTIPVGYAIGSTTSDILDEHGKPRANKYPFIYEDLNIFGQISGGILAPIIDLIDPQCRVSVENYYRMIFATPDNNLPCYPKIFLETDKVNSTDLPSFVNCTFAGLCEDDETNCVEYCQYLRPDIEECTQNAEVADAAIEAVMNVDPPSCSLPNFKTDPIFDCQNPSKGNPVCLYAEVIEEAILLGADFAKIDTAIELIFGESASVGFVCSIAESVADGKQIPGRCCLDAPYSKQNETTWGQPYTCNDECEQPGVYFAGLDVEACNAYGGTWCSNPQDCTELKECVQNFINNELAKSDDGKTQTGFSSYLTTSPRITNPTDTSQCQSARQYFGFDADFLDDVKICADIEQLRFTNDFSFLDEFFNQGTSLEVGAECTSGGVECFLQQPDFSDIPCGGAPGGTKWRLINFVFTQVSGVANDVYQIVNILCPEDALSKIFCAKVEVIFYSISAVIRIGTEISKFQYSETCEFGNAEPQEILRMTKILYPNMVSILEKIIDVKSTVQSIEGAIESVQGAINAIPPPPVPIDPNPNPITSNGCNDFDDDFDGFIDECDEDDNPPQVVVPDSVRQINTCPEGVRNTICLDWYFKTTDEAISYLESTLRAEDDCAQGSALRLDISSDRESNCDMTKFMVTPVHKCTSPEGIEAEVCGTVVTFVIGVDNQIPDIKCGFHSKFAAKAPDGKTNILILQEDDGNLVDTGFYVDVEENCRDNVKIDISVESNEALKPLHEMIFLERRKNLQGVTQASLCVDSGYCDPPKHGKHSGSFCLGDPDPRVVTRFYEIKVDATDLAGNKDTDICVVFVRPTNANLSRFADDLWQSYDVWSQTRYELGSLSLDWDNELAPSEMPSMMPSVSVLPSLSLVPSSMPSSLPSSMPTTAKKSKQDSPGDDDRKKKGSKKTDNAAADEDDIEAALCDICPVGQCYQLPSRVYPQENDRLDYVSAVGAGVTYRNNERSVGDITCAAIEILANIPGAMRLSYCHKLQDDAKLGACGGCGSVGCAS